MSIFNNNNFEYKKGYEDGKKWGTYDYSMKHGPEYDAGFMAGYFEKYGYTYDGKTSSQLEAERLALQNQSNRYYAKTLFGDVNPLTVKVASLVKSFVALAIIGIITCVSSFLHHLGSDSEDTKTEQKNYQQEELVYSSDAQRPKTSVESKNGLVEAEFDDSEPNVQESGAVNEEDFIPYMKEVERRIKMNWEPPKGNASRQIVVLMKISKDGRLLSYQIQKSSGSEAADRAAVRAIKLAAPFRPLPAQYKGDSVDIQFSFDYNVISK